MSGGSFRDRTCGPGAIAAGCRAEPGLNGFYDGESMSRQLEARVDVAMSNSFGFGGHNASLVLARLDS